MYETINNDNKPVAFFIQDNPFYYQPIQFIPIEEIYVPVTEKLVPNIKPFYWISNYGNLYSTFKNKLISPGIDSKGYPYAALATLNGPKNMRIHRLVLMSFSYFEGCEKVIINHCDGIKTHPWVWNLEWSSYSANQIHAYSIGLTPKYSTNITMSDEDVIKIADLLMENKYSCTELAKMFNTNVDMIYSIKHKRAYINLTENYNFPETKYLYNDDMIAFICKTIQDNPIEKPFDTMSPHQKHDYLMKIINLCNLPHGRQSIDLVNRIYQKKSFTHISSKFNF